MGRIMILMGLVLLGPVLLVSCSNSEPTPPHTSMPRPAATVKPTPTPTAIPPASLLPTSETLVLTEVQSTTGVVPIPENMAADLQNIRQERRFLNGEINRMTNAEYYNQDEDEICDAVESNYVLFGFYHDVLIGGFLERYSDWSDTAEYREVEKYKELAGYVLEAIPAIWPTICEGRELTPEWQNPFHA